jgi:uracil-DNA glycosylase family protein
MAKRPSRTTAATAAVAAPPARDRRSLSAVRKEAQGCQRCPLWARATQTVFGAGPLHAPIMLVGEQPGDVEDREGEPFVGPAGRLLRDALAEAGIALEQLYLTNAVKHFKWKPRGKRRLHERPNHEEVMACRMWLELEIDKVKPKIVVALGATAAGALLGSSVRVMRDRTKKIPSPFAQFVTVTVHPSSILRAPDSTARQAAFAQFVHDLRHIAGWI